MCMNALINSYLLVTCLGFITVYDVVQILGGVSLVFFLMFVRSQYLRVEQVTWSVYFCSN